MSAAPELKSLIYDRMIAEDVLDAFHMTAQGQRWVYETRLMDGAYKIGYAQKPADRLRTFNVKLPFEVEYEVLLKTDDMRGLESSLHEYYSEKHINGEWFALTDDDLAELRQLSGAQ